MEKSQKIKLKTDFDFRLCCNYDKNQNLKYEIALQLQCYEYTLCLKRIKFT